MTIHTLQYEFHAAYLDPEYGCGLLVLPDPDADVFSPDWSSSIHCSALAAVAQDLVRRFDFDIAEAESVLDDFLIEDVRADGRTIVALCGRSPIVSAPTIGQLGSAIDDLRDLAGLGSLHEH